MQANKLVHKWMLATQYSSPDYIRQVTFEELLAAQPNSDFEAWNQAAQRQLNGKPLSAVAVQVDDEHFVPYATGAAEQQSRSSSFNWEIIAPTPSSRVPWTQLLDWGAQGLFLDAQTDVPSAEELAKIRFDFLSLYGEVEKGHLSELVVSEQRTNSVWCMPSVESADTVWPVGRLLTNCPASLSKRALVKWCQQELIPALLGARRMQDGQVRLAARVALPASYPSTLVLCRVVHLLYANASVACGFAEPLSPIRLLGWIDARANCDSPEAFLIDAAVRAVAGATAGVAAILVVPFDDTPAQQRRALNLQHVLQLEGGFDYVEDALQGAHWVEQVAAHLAREVWAELSHLV